jgi:hypothetical protein
MNTVWYSIWTPHTGLVICRTKPFSEHGTNQSAKSTPAIQRNRIVQTRNTETVQTKKQVQNPLKRLRSPSIHETSKVNPQSISDIHKTVKHPRLIFTRKAGGWSLKRNITLKQRRELETKMFKVFKENIKGLSTELQKIMVDDLVTAFESRINVLIRAQEKRSY